MARCAFCNQVIVVGGLTSGDRRYCSEACLLKGRALVQDDARDGLSGFRETIRELREDLDALADEVEQQRRALAEAAERLDFAERRIVQLHEAAAEPPHSQGR